MASYNPLPFADIQDLHKELGGGMSLVDFAKTANRATGSNMFDQAVGNPFSIGIKQASSGIDRFLDEYAGPVNETLGEGGAWLFDAVGADKEFGRQVGEDLLRGVVDYIPAIAGTALAPFTGGASAYAGLAATAALSGANAYEKTDSELMGLTSAALAGFGGKLTEFGATTALRGAAKIPALKALGISGGAKQIINQGDEVIEQLVAKQVGDRVLGAVAGESFVNVTGLLADAGVGLVETGEWNNPFTKENILADMLDPTVLFGVKELVSPSVISQKVIQHSDELKQFTNADTEESLRREQLTVPSLVGNNAAEIERAYRDLRMQAEAIKDKDQKKVVLTQLEESRALAREQTTELEPGAARTLFGEALVTKLDEELFTPKTVDTVDESGQIVKEEVTLEKILSPEELTAYNEGLRDILSPQSMIRLAELSEMDTPKTENEFRDTIVQMNAVRAELERGMVDDSWLQKKITEKTNEGDSVEVASEKAWQVAKNETEGMVEAKKRPKAVREEVAPVEGEVVEPSAPIEKLSLTETDPDIVKAKEAVEDVEEEEWTPTDWSKLPSVREVPNSPEGIVGKLKAADEKRKRPTGKRKNPLLDAGEWEDPDDVKVRERKERQEIARLLGETEEDGEIAFFPSGTKPLVEGRPLGDEALSVTLSDVLGVEDKTGDVFVGNLSAKFARGLDVIDEKVIAKWFSRFGLGSKTWEAYKLAYPEMLTGDGKVKMAVVLEVAKKPLVKVDVHGAKKDTASTTYFKLQHKFETEHREPQVQFKDIYDYVDKGPGYALPEYEAAAKDFLDRYPEWVPLLQESARNNMAIRDPLGDQDFARQYGFVAPDNFEPFDPETGLGNVAYELRVPGVKGGGQHTGNDDTLAWVRGKYVMVADPTPKADAAELQRRFLAGESPTDLEDSVNTVLPPARKVFRIDEVQSDAAQQAIKQQNLDIQQAERNIAEFERQVEKLSKAAVVQEDKTTGPVFFIKTDKDTWPYGFDGREYASKEEATRYLSTSLSAARANVGHAQTGLRRAKADKGHPFFDNYESMALRVAIERAKENGADEIFLPDGETAMMSEGHDRQGTVLQDGVYQRESIANQALFDDHTIIASGKVKVDGGIAFIEDTRGVYHDYIDMIGVTRDELEIPSAPVPQSKGMTDAYDRRLPQTTAKLLGDSGTKTVLGSHGKGPSPVFRDGQEGKSSVTGKTYPLSRSGFFEDRAFESVRVETRNELIRRSLAKDGSMSNKAIEASLPTFDKLSSMFDGDDVQLFEILDGSVRGAATTKGAVRKLFLGDKGLEGLDDNGRVFAQSFVFAHELGHNSEQLYNQGLLSQRHWDQFDKFKRWTEESTVEDRKLALELMRDGMVNKKHHDSDVVRLAMEAVDDPKEARANLMSMWAMGQLEKPDGVAMNLLPGPVRKGLQVLSDLYHSVVSAFRGVSSFDLMFKNRQATRAQLDQMSNMMKTWKKELNKSQDFYTEAQGLLTVGPAAYRDTLAFFGKKGEIDRTSVLPHDTRGLATRVFDEWIMPFDQLTQMVPQFKGIAADLHNYTGDVRAALNRIAGMVAGEVTTEGKVSFANRTVKMEWKQVRDDQKLNKLASNWMRAQQEAPGLVVGKGRKLSFEDLKEFSPDTHKQLAALSDKQRKAVINVVTRMGKAMEKLQDEVLKTVNASNESMVMSYIANKMPEIRRDAPGLAQLLSRGIRDIKSTDPTVAQGGQLMLSQVATKLGHEQFYKTYDIATKAADSFEKLNVELKSSPHFFSEMRFGKHFLHWTRPDGKSGGLAFDSLNDARAKEKQLRDSGASVTLESTTRGAARMVGRDQLLDRLEEFDERGKALVDVLDLDDETKRILKTEFNSRWEFLRDVNAAKIVEPGSKRHLAEGREDLDMIQTQMLYFQVAMRTLNKKLLNHRLNYRFSDPELNDPKVMAMRPQLDSMIKNFFNPDTELGRGISTFNAGYFLGGNLSSHLIELMQPGFSFVPELINRNVGFLEAQKMTLKAMTEVGMFTAKHIPSAFGKLVKRHLPEGRGASQTLLEGRDDNTLWANAEYGPLMEYAASRGKISLGHASDTMDVDVENNVDITGMLGKGRGDAHPFKKYGITPAMDLVRFPLKFYQQFTEFNARVSLILGYELAKKQKGVSKQRAVEEALEFSNTVTFSGGKLNRPNQLFTGEGTYRTAGQALYSLQGYTFGMLGMMRRYAETGYSSKQFPGLTSEQRAAARKSLKTMLATQFLGAGALGMPFVQAAMLLMENLTGVEFEREMREGLAEMFEEDEEDEGLLSDAVMHGAANAILGSMLPGDPDLGSRFAIGGVMGVNSYNGYSLEQMFGATGSVIKNVVNGSTEIARGNVAQGLIDMAPVAVKRIADTIKNEGELRDRNGALLIDATFGEKIANAVGFAPQAVKKMRNTERLQARHEEKVRTDMIRKFDDLTEMYMENPMGLREAVRDMADNDPKVQLAREMGDRERAKVEFIASQRAAAAKIADRLEKKIFPKDSGRNGTLRGTYGESTGTGQVTEVARMQLKAQVEQNLGLQPGLTQRSMQRAAIIDRLMQQNPGLGRPEAAARADLLIARL